MTTDPPHPRRVATPDRNLAVLLPDVAALWHPTRNGKLTPTDVLPGSDPGCGGSSPLGWCVTVSAWSSCPFRSGRRVGVHPDNPTTFADLQHEGVGGEERVAPGVQWPVPEVRDVGVEVLRRRDERRAVRVLPRPVRPGPSRPPTPPATR